MICELYFSEEECDRNACEAFRAVPGYDTHSLNKTIAIIVTTKNDL